MLLKNSRSYWAALAIVVATMASVYAQGPRQSRETLRSPVYRVPSDRLVAQAPARAPAQPAAAVPAAQEQAAQHPLAPIIARAEEAREKLRKEVKDYSATLVKRERIDGVLLGHQYIYTKIRQEQENGRGEVTAPFSVYMNFLAPDDVKGRECLYVQGRNGNKLTAHDGGTGLLQAIKAAVTVNIDPESDLAMNGNKYPITDVGLENLLTKLIVAASEDMQRDPSETKVDTFKGTKINDRVCTCLQSVHPVNNGHYRFHIARIYVDDELQLPIRYESYGWPTREGEKPPLLEEYTYLNLKLNNGFTDRDFDRANANYNFN